MEDLELLYKKLNKIDPADESSYSDLKDVLKTLKGMPITVAMHQRVPVGKLVNTLRKKCKDTDVQAMAKKLLKTWQKEAAAPRAAPTPASTPGPSPASTPVSTGAEAPVAGAGADGGAGAAAAGGGAGLVVTAGAGDGPSTGGPTSPSGGIEALFEDFTALKPPTSKAREKVCRLLTKAVLKLVSPDDSAAQEQASQMCIRLELEMFKRLGGKDPEAPAAAYNDKFRSLVFHLGENQALVDELLGTTITMEMLFKMSPEELMSGEAKASRAKALQDRMEAVQLDWAKHNKKKQLSALGIERKEGMFPCKRCKSTDTDFYQKQTRSADEPMTTFVTCMRCDFAWRFG